MVVTLSPDQNAANINAREKKTAPKIRELREKKSCELFFGQIKLRAFHTGRNFLAFSALLRRSSSFYYVFRADNKDGVLPLL